MQKIIFAVDDSDTNLTHVEDVLEQHYCVLTMSSAEKMFELLGKMTPQLILLDIEMPGMSGLEAMDILQADRRHASIPVIFLTAKKCIDVEDKCFSMGAADFISKPFANRGLLSRVETHITVRSLLKECVR